MIFPKSIHTAGMDFLKGLLVDENDNDRVCSVVYPTDSPSMLKNMKFVNIPCLTSSIDEDRLKNSNTIFSNNTLIITLLYKDIDKFYDTTNKFYLPKKNIKKDNPKVTYKGKTYTILMEQVSEFANAIDLYCDTKD